MQCPWVYVYLVQSGWNILKIYLVLVDSVCLNSSALMIIEKFSIGMGDRFAHQGVAQLRAIVQGRALGLDLVPVWNKSNREHTIVKSVPQSVRDEADAAVKALCWDGSYHVDADHIGLKTVDGFIAASDFFTLDVADYVAKAAPVEEIERFVADHRRYVGELSIAGIATPLVITEELLRRSAEKFLFAMQEAGRIYRHIAAAKQAFITEVSVDETDTPQTPVDLFLILAMLARENVPVQTIAPKFTGRFNKGVDYVGDLVQFEKEFDEDLCVIAFAIKEFALPASLKLSVHSGSDKFSIYPIINRLVKKHGAGLHVKTAGTTWLEELIGLADAGEGDLVKEIYRKAFARYDELAAPYATVIDIDKAELPSPEEVDAWSCSRFAESLRHVQSNPHYNLHFRQLLHVAFKVAAELGERYTDALKKNAEIVGKNVTENLFERHVKPIFG